MAGLKDDGDGGAAVDREEVARLHRISRYTHVGGIHRGERHSGQTDTDIETRLPTIC